MTAGNSSTAPDPADLGSQLDELLASQWRPAHWPKRIDSPEELPASVERWIRFLGPNIAWRAYSNFAETFCAIARTSSVSMTSPRAALEVCFLDNDAKIYSAGRWERDSDINWHLTGSVC